MMPVAVSLEVPQLLLAKDLPVLVHPPTQTRHRYERAVSKTHRKLIEFPECLDIGISVLPIEWRLRRSRTWGELIGDRAGQNVLTQLLDLMVHNGLQRISGNQTLCWTSQFCEKDLVCGRLHFDLEVYAVDCNNGLVVDR